MTVLVSALAFFLLLSFLVLIHELGHFSMARKFGVAVEEFGFGLPPRAKTLFWKGGTRFSLNWIPFGGFVRLQGENASTESDRRRPGSFAAASIPARVIILVAGVFMNFIFAIVVFALGFSLWHWIPTYLSVDAMKAASARGEITLSPGVRVASTEAGGTAARAKFPTPSVLLSVDGKPVAFPTDVVDFQKDKKTVTYTYTKEGETAVRTLTLQTVEGKTGIAIEFRPQVISPRRPLLTGVYLALREAKVATIQTALGISHLVSSVAWHGTVPEGITGIVGIAQLTHDSVQAGLSAYIRLMAILSLSLATLNILPFPSLDGGRLLFVLIEGILRQPAPRRFELITNTVGFMVLIALIIIVTFNDILRLF